MSRISSRSIGNAGPVVGVGAVTASRVPGRLTDDLKLFAASWIGGLVFFTTLLG